LICVLIARNIVDMSTIEVLEAYSLLRREINYIRSTQMGFHHIGYKQMLLLTRLMKTEASMGELADFTLSDKASMTRMVRSLEKAGLVKRKAFAGDRRMSIIELTARGRVYGAKAQEVRKSLGAIFNSALSAHEQKELTRLLNKTSAAMQKIRLAKKD